MSHADTVPVPPPSRELFREGIKHPKLWLWDAWTYQDREELHLFTLALSRLNAEGAPIRPSQRNDYPFHVRRFVSKDEGRSWQDLGAYLQPSDDPASVSHHNVWSGSAHLKGGNLLFGFTGVRRAGRDCPFIQSICAFEAPAMGRAHPDMAVVLSDPERDYGEILRKGYYLGPKDSLGSALGEEGGPILAWRDPFFVEEEPDVYRVYWAAKTGPSEPAVAQARVVRRNGVLELDTLLEPIVPPDAQDYTQSEVPKVYQDPKDGSLLMLTSTCNRLREDQPDEEVSKELRLFRAPGFDGPWEPYSAEGAVLPGTRHLFGGEFGLIDHHAGRATLIAPNTEMASSELQLTFAPPVEILFGRETAEHMRPLVSASTA
ncbi:hypothetical protein [Parvularcula maris]|uniref:Uncharacterized protein n=1 Tax=Parvularcula maris TaxID=2965077 RepID=A0A9X2L7Q7_9PROT|nr:hypothetical protein [Parvularcula maris]MCQ8184624.1 hypothetical protein [Parvularcula maris]